MNFSRPRRYQTVSSRSVALVEVVEGQVSGVEVEAGAGVGVGVEVGAGGEEREVVTKSFRPPASLMPLITSFSRV